MSEIPADVTDAAKAALKGCETVLFSQWGLGQLGVAYKEAVAIDAIARAIMDERERCAKIAEGWQVGLQTAEIIDNAICRLADRIRRGDA